MEKGLRAKARAKASGIMKKVAVTGHTTHIVFGGEKRRSARRLLTTMAWRNCSELRLHEYQLTCYRLPQPAPLVAF